MLNHHMKYYTSTTEINCGMNLRELAHQLYACSMDRQEKTLAHSWIKNNYFTMNILHFQEFLIDLCKSCD